MSQRISETKETCPVCGRVYTFRAEVEDGAEAPVDNQLSDLGVVCPVCEAGLRKAEEDGEAERSE